MHDMNKLFASGFLLLGLLGCNDLKVSDADIPIVNEKQIEEAMNDPKGRTVVVDVRKPESYAAGHIPGAINVYLPDIRKSDERLGHANRIIVYGKGFTDPLGVAAAKRLVAEGYKNVWEFKGGMEAWQSSQRPVTTQSESRPDSR